MSFSPSDLADIRAALDAGGADAGAVAALRRRFAGLSFTRCAASDVDGDTPYFTGPAYSLFLVDGADHCWRLTDDPARATGLVIVPNGGRG